MHTTLRITGLECAACAPNLAKKLNEAGGISSATVNYASSKCSLDYDENVIGLEKICTKIKHQGFDIPTVTMTFESEDILDSIPDSINSIPGVKSAEIQDRKIIITLWPVDCEPESIIKKFKELNITIRHLETIGSEEDIQLHGRMDLLRLLCVSVLFTMPLVWDLHPYIQFVLATIVQIKAGGYFYKSAIKSIRAKSLSMNILISLSSTIIYLYSVVVTFTVTTDIKLYYLCGCVLLCFILFGKYLENLSKWDTSSAIRKLIRLQPKTATVICGNVEKQISIEDITPHDFIRIHPGERISVDGIIIEGRCCVDESMLTGESIPVDKMEGDRVLAGTLNRSGSAIISASDIGKDTVLKQIVDIIEKAQASKSPIEKTADKIAAYFIPAVTIISLIVFSLWFFYLDKYNLDTAIYCVCSVLVIACPCALGLATPTAIMVTSGKAAEMGILFRTGEQLETVGKADTVLLDKTGTITYGEMEVTNIIPLSDDYENALIFASSVERMSEHPVAQAIVKCVSSKFKDALPLTVDRFENIQSKGVKGTVLNHDVICGTRLFLEESGVDISKLDSIEDLRLEAKTEVLVSVDGNLSLCIATADQIRSEATTVIQKLVSMGKKVYMLTGDNEKTARSIAKQAGIENVFFEVSPMDKADIVKKLQDEGNKVCMVGDGINDAPALTSADIGIALSTGTDVAIEAGGIVLMNGRLSTLPMVFEISSRTMKKIRQNLCWALFYNICLIPLAASAYINPSMAAASMSLSSNGVLLN